MPFMIVNSGLLLPGNLIHRRAAIRGRVGGNSNSTLAAHAPTVTSGDNATARQISMQNKQSTAAKLALTLVHFSMPA
jgi:hypothetical protein